MYDSNDDTKVTALPSEDDKTKLVASHYTEVEPRTKVKWIWTPDSEIKNFVKIGPITPGAVIPGDAKRVLFTKKRRLKIPSNAPSNTEQEYLIEFLDEQGKTITIDPYLKIR